MTNAPKPVVLFDMDGVLVDVSGSYRRAICETAGALLGRTVDPAEVQRYKNRGGFNDDWRLTEAIVRDGGGLTPFEDIVRAFDARYRGAAWDGYIAGEPPLLDGTVLDRLAGTGHVLGVVTGRPREEAEWTLRRFDWLRRFDVVVALEDQAGRTKPDPYPLELAFDRLGEVERSRAVYVGDTVDDMRAARSAGARAIGFIPPYLLGTGLEQRLVEAGADRVLASHAELADTVRGLLG